MTSIVFRSSSVPGGAGTEQARLWQLLAPEAYAGVEYSYGEDHETFGLTIPVEPPALPRLWRWSSAIGQAGDWSWAAHRVAEYVQPTTYLLRTDWRRGTPGQLTAMTLYCRFPVEPDDERFAAVVRLTHPAQWCGPAPGAIAKVLGVSGPRGIALRVGESERVRLAVYFQIRESASALSRDTAAALVEACGLSPEIADELIGDLPRLYRGRPLGVVGLDDGQAPRAGALKLNPSDVPCAMAWEFLVEHGAERNRVEQLRQAALALRTDHISYLGVRYTAEGFSGWRVYVSIEPFRVPSPQAQIIREPLRAVPTRRSPHH